MDDSVRVFSGLLIFSFCLVPAAAIVSRWIKQSRSGESTKGLNRPVLDPPKYPKTYEARYVPLRVGHGIKENQETPQETPVTASDEAVQADPDVIRCDTPIEAESPCTATKMALVRYVAPNDVVMRRKALGDHAVSDPMGMPELRVFINDMVKLGYDLKKVWPSRGQHHYAYMVLNKDR